MVMLIAELTISARTWQDVLMASLPNWVVIEATDHVVVMRSDENELFTVVDSPNNKSRFAIYRQGWLVRRCEALSEVPSALIKESHKDFVEDQLLEGE